MELKPNSGVVRIEPSIYAQIKELAKSDRRSAASFINIILAEYLAKQNNRK